MKYNPTITLAYFKSEGIPKPELEYQFHPDRKWRFDFAWPTNGEAMFFPKLYLECDGGIWIKGGHNRGAQMKKDWEKRNAATILGWRGLWVEPKELCMDSTARMIKEALGI